MRYNKTEAKFKSHYILKRFFRQFAINDNDVSAGKSNRECHSIYVAIVFLLGIEDVEIAC